MYALILVIGSVVAVSSAKQISENDIPELHFLDTSADPCDDFHRYACGNFKNFSNRPEDIETVDLFTMTGYELVKAGNKILSSPKRPRDPAALKKVKSAYRACMDTNYTDSLPYNPEQTLIDRFGMPLVTGVAETKTSWAQIGEIVGSTGIQQLFSLSVLYLSPDESMLMIYKDTLKEPEMIRPQSPKSYDQVLEESFRDAAKKTKKARLLSNDPFDTFLRKVATNLINGNVEYSLNEDKLLKDLDDIKQFKAKLEEGGDTSGYNCSLDPVNVTLGQLQNWTDCQFGDEIDLNWVEYVGNISKPANITVNEDTVIFNAFVATKFIYGILNLVRNTDPNTVKNFVLLRTFLYLAPDSSKPNRDAFESYYRSVGHHYYDRWEYCTRKILDVADAVSLSFAVAHEYQLYHFDTNKIPHAVKLIRELKDAFKESVALSGRVDRESRDPIYEKIDNLIVNLGYPDFVDKKNRLDAFYENVRICEWDHYGNSLTMRAFKQAYALTEYIDKDYWKTSPFQVNAFARKQSLWIMMPLSMLHDNFFQNNNPVLEYSRLGSTIAHEMTHHFDKGGVGYDQAGDSSSTWVSDATLDALNETFECLIKQYDGYYVPEIDKYVHGSNTLNENTADHGGLRKSLLAFKEHIGKNNVQNKSGRFTPEQLFFIGYATMWCSDDSASYLDYLVDHDEHSPNRVRILGPLSNMQEFSDAFNCPVGSNMNREEKCVVW